MFPSLVSPRMATKTSPRFRRRESYSRPVTCGLPLWASTSAPARSSRRVTGLSILQVGKQPVYESDYRNGLPESAVLIVLTPELHGDSCSTRHVRTSRRILFPS